MADETQYKTVTESSSPPSAKAITSVPTSSEKKRPREIQGSDTKSEVLILTCTCGKTKQHVRCTNVAKEIFPPIWTCEECLKGEDSVEQTVFSPTRSDASVNQPSKSASPSVSMAMDISPAKKQKKLQDDSD